MIRQINKNIYCKLVIEKENIAEKILKLQYEIYPEHKNMHFDIGYNNYKQGISHFISQLAEAINQDEVILFVSYANWAKTTLEGMGIGAIRLSKNLECALIIFKQTFQEDEYQILKSFIESALEQFTSENWDIPSYINRDQPFSELSSQYLYFALKGNKRKAIDLVIDAAKNGVSVKDIYQNVFECTQYEIGRLWQLGKISVAQEHYCTALTQLIIGQLYPIAFNQRTETNRNTFIGTCISDELHELGIRMVTDFFELSGWDASYLGANMPNKDLMKLVDEKQPEVIGLSATMTINISRVEALINEIRKNYGNEKVKIIVGGYPFNLTANLWRNIGADGQSRNASEAVELGNMLIQKRKDYQDEV